MKIGNSTAIELISKVANFKVRSGPVTLTFVLTRNGKILTRPGKGKNVGKTEVLWYKVNNIPANTIPLDATLKETGELLGCPHPFLISSIVHVDEDNVDYTYDQTLVYLAELPSDTISPAIAVEIGSNAPDPEFIALYEARRPVEVRSLVKPFLISHQLDYAATATPNIVTVYRPNTPTVLVLRSLLAAENND